MIKKEYTNDHEYEIVPTDPYEPNNLISGPCTCANLPRDLEWKDVLASFTPGFKWDLE